MSNERLYKVGLTKSELEAVILFNLSKHADSMDIGSVSIDTSKRIHDLTKRLTSDSVDVEKDQLEEVKEPAQTQPEAETKPSGAWG